MSTFYEVVDWITKASVVPGVFLNLLLIALVRKYSRNDIGTFRYLLFVFAVYDIILCILHCLLDPKVLVFPGIFSCVLDFPYGSRFLTAVHFNLFMISYAILIVHLLYRYWVIRKPYNIAHFSSPSFILKLIASIVAVGALLVELSLVVVEPEDSPERKMIKDAFIHKYNRTIDDGWLVAIYWPNNEWNIAACVVACCYDVVGGAIVSVVVTLAYLTYHHISSAFGLSASTRGAQMQLLKTVCVQTFIPMICVMIPYFVNLTLPIFGITIPIITETTGFVMSFFPTWDPLAVILLMKPYRVGLCAIITRRKPSVHLSVKCSVSTIVL